MRREEHKIRKIIREEVKNVLEARNRGKPEDIFPALRRSIAYDQIHKARTALEAAVRKGYLSDQTADDVADFLRKLGSMKSDIKSLVQKIKSEFPSRSSRI